MIGRSMARKAGIPLLALVALAACGDSTGVATDYDPRVTLDRLNDVLYDLGGDADFLGGLDLAVVTLEWYGGSALADAVALRPVRRRPLLQSSRPVPRSAAPSAAGPGTDPGDGMAALTLPYSLVGRTMVWDGDEYVPGTAAGPTNGVRFVLYRMEWVDGYPVPVLPLSEVGYLDILDEDESTAEVVRVRAVRSVGTSRVVASYAVAMVASGSYANGAMEITAQGTVGEGAAIDLDLLQRLTWSESADRDELTLDYRYERSNRLIRLEAEAESPFDVSYWSTFDFELRVEGSTTTVVDARVHDDDSLSGEIRSDGRRAIRITGYDGSPVFERADNRTLSWSEIDALEQLWYGIADLISLTDWILAPADLLVAAG